MDMGGDVLEDITKLGDVTILAPSNEAWAAMNVQNVIRWVNHTFRSTKSLDKRKTKIIYFSRNRDKIREILNMHIIKDSLNTEKIRQRNANQVIDDLLLEIHHSFIMLMYCRLLKCQMSMAEHSFISMWRMRKESRP